MPLSQEAAHGDSHRRTVITMSALFMCRKRVVFFNWAGAWCHWGTDSRFAGYQRLGAEKDAAPLQKSNPPLLEWLSSDIVYYEAFTTAKQLRKLRTEAFKPEASVYHYINMARRNVKDYLQGQEVKIKSISMCFGLFWLANGLKSTEPFRQWILLFWWMNLSLTLSWRQKWKPCLNGKKRWRAWSWSKNSSHSPIHWNGNRKNHGSSKTLKAEHKDMTPELNRLLLNTVEEVWKDGGSWCFCRFLFSVIRQDSPTF